MAGTKNTDNLLNLVNVPMCSPPPLTNTLPSRQPKWSRTPSGRKKRVHGKVFVGCRSPKILLFCSDFFCRCALQLSFFVAQIPPLPLRPSHSPPTSSGLLSSHFGPAWPPPTPAFLRWLLWQCWPSAPWPSPTPSPAPLRWSDAPTAGRFFWQWPPQWKAPKGRIWPSEYKALPPKALEGAI